MRSSTRWMNWLDRIWDDVRATLAAEQQLRINLPTPPGWKMIGPRNHFDGPTAQLLENDLGHSLTGISRFIYGDLNRYGFSTVLDPSFPHYNARIGAFIVSDSDEMSHVGFDDRGLCDVGTLCAVLRSEYRAILTGAGCPKPFGYDIRPDAHIGSVSGDNGHEWTVIRVRIDTWSPLHRGRNPAGQDGYYRAYGTVPEGLFPDQEDFHAVTHATTLLAYYDDRLRATLCRYYNSAEWRNRNDTPVSTVELIGPAQRAIADSIGFVVQRPEQEAPRQLELTLSAGSGETITIGAGTEADVAAATAVVSDGSTGYTGLVGEDRTLGKHCIMPSLTVGALSSLRIARHESSVVGVAQFLTRRRFWDVRPWTLVSAWIRIQGIRRTLRTVLDIIPTVSLFVFRRIRVDELHVAIMAVAKGWQQAGIDRLLIEYAQAEARRRGLHAVTLHVAEEDAVARELYDSMGFAVDRELKPWLGRRVESGRCLLMVKDLGRGLQRDCQV